MVIQGQERKFGIGDFLHRGSTTGHLAVLKSQAVATVGNLSHALKPKTVLLIVVVVAILALFGRNIKDILLVSALAVAASYSTIYKRTIRVPSAVELVTFGTVITGAAYGPLAGALFGILTTIASEIISSGVDVNTLFYAVSRGIAGGLAQMLMLNFGLGVVITGMAALVIFHVVSDAIYVMSAGVEAVPKVAYFVIVNTLFNFIMFSFFGGLALKLALL